MRFYPTSTLLTLSLFFGSIGSVAAQVVEAPVVSTTDKTANTNNDDSANQQNSDKATHEPDALLILDRDVLNTKIRDLEARVERLRKTQVPRAWERKSIEGRLERMRAMERTVDVLLTRFETIEQRLSELESKLSTPNRK